MSIIEKAVDKLFGDAPREQQSQVVDRPAYYREEIPENAARAEISPDESHLVKGTDSINVPDLESEFGSAPIELENQALRRPEKSEKELPTVTDTVAAPRIEVYREEGGSVDSAVTPDIKSDVELVGLNLEGVISLDEGRSRLAEEYRMIKRPLLAKALSVDQATGRHQNLIMVTSSVSGEGKTFTSLNLAVSIAMEMDRTVLLVDADLAKPQLSRRLNINERQGFTECLKDSELDLGKFLLRTDVPKLTILAAGNRNNRATELLASNTMTMRLNELASRYPDRVILFDSPPLLATSESSTLASHMDQVAMVVEYGVTPQYLVKEALSLLEPEGLVSLILNKTRDEFFIKNAGGYGYGYGKGYGYGTYGDN